MSDNRDTQNTAEERGAALTLSTHMTEPAGDDKSGQHKNALIHAISATRVQNSSGFGGEKRSVAIVFGALGSARAVERDAKPRRQAYNRGL